MAVCFATLQQFSELENCFIDGTPMSFGEQEISKELFVTGWDMVPKERGSVHDTVSESLESEALRTRKPSMREFASRSKGTGYSPDESYSPVLAYDVLDDYLDGSRWRGLLPDKTPSSEEKVAQWMTYENDQPNNIDNNNTTIEIPIPLFGAVKDRRPRGMRSRSIILRFETQQRQNSQSRRVSINQYTPAQVQPDTQDSRTKRRKNIDTTSNHVGVEKTLPELPRKASLKNISTMDSRRVQYERHLLPSTEQNSIVVGLQVQPEQQSPVPQNLRSAIGDSTSEHQRPIMPRRVSKSRSTKSPSTSIIISSSPKPLQLVMKVNQQEAESPRHHKSRKSRDQALRQLESVEGDNQRTLRHSRSKSENVDIGIMRETLGLSPPKALTRKASVGQIETIMRQSTLAGRRERPRPAPIDMGAVLEANISLMEMELATTPKSGRRDSGAFCETPLFTAHPSALIPRPLSLSPKKREKDTTGDLQMLSPLEKLESNHDRLMRHKRFFDNRPLCRSLDGDGVDEITIGLFDRLLEETTLYEARQSVLEFYQRRAFWDNVRLELSVEDGEEFVGAEFTWL